MREKVWFMILAVAVLLMTTCSGQVELPDEPAAERAEAGACPGAGTDTRLLIHPQHGYCLLYPIAYKVEKPSSGRTDLVIGSLLNVTDPRIEIAVEAANGRTAAELADRVALDFSPEGEPGAVSIGGVHAIILDKLPGQEINRQLFFDHQGLIYRLTFLPADENLPAYEAMAQLYDMVLASFTFIPVAQGLAAGYDCLQPKAGEVTLTNSDLGFCLLHPEGYSAEDTDENQTVLYVDSLLSVSHPKLFIEVRDVGGQDAQALAEAAAAESEAVMPGLPLGRTFGLSIGYEPASVLDDVPGQDISRQVFAVQGDRLYRLTFVPASEDAGEVYAEMEGLYELVTRSFRFLR